MKVLADILQYLGLGSWVLGMLLMAASRLCLLPRMIERVGMGDKWLTPDEKLKLEPPLTKQLRRTAFGALGLGFALLTSSILLSRYAGGPAQPNNSVQDTAG